MKISETLYKAAEHIEAHGWYQGYYWPHPKDRIEPPYVQGDPCCALGAIAVVEDSDPMYDTDAMKELADYLGIGVGLILGKSAGVADWNDTAGRTKEEVLAALRGAALRAEKAGR